MPLYGTSKMKIMHNVLDFVVSIVSAYFFAGTLVTCVGALLVTFLQPCSNP